MSDEAVDPFEAFYAVLEGTAEDYEPAAPAELIDYDLYDDIMARVFYRKSDETYHQVTWVENYKKSVGRNCVVRIVEVQEVIPVEQRIIHWQPLTETSEKDDTTE